MKAPARTSGRARVRQAVASAKHVASHENDEALIRKCVASWVRTYRHIAKCRARPKGEYHPITWDSVDKLLADKGIVMEFGPTPSLYRVYEEEIVRRAYEEMQIPRFGIVRKCTTKSDDDERARVVELAEMGWSRKEIACEMERSVGFVGRAIRRARQANSKKKPAKAERAA